MVHMEIQKEPQEGHGPFQRELHGVLQRACLEGQGDLVSRLITPIIHIVPQLSPLLTYLPDPPY